MPIQTWILRDRPTFKDGVKMDDYFNYFMDILPVFICIADAETKAPVYYNKLAAECFENMPEEKSIDFVRDVIKLESLIKFCENSCDSERGRWYLMVNKTIKWLDGQDRILIVGSDHSRSIFEEENLTVAAYTDALTGIYNRQIGLEMLTKFINELKIGAPAFTMCFVDLDDLKYVNDRYGHSAGDLYIETIVKLIKQSIRQSDVFARMGGDEFLVIFPKCKSEVVVSIMKEVSKMLDGINENNDPKTYYSISYGVLEVGPEDGLDMEALLAEAGALMYKMKAEYKMMRILPD